jgi:hypothetical protein
VTTKLTTVGEWEKAEMIEKGNKGRLEKGRGVEHIFIYVQLALANNSFSAHRSAFKPITTYTTNTSFSMTSTTTLNVNFVSSYP